MANVSSEQENIQTFYREQNELLFRYAMLLTGDRHQAEEALQTAWCQCLTYRETFFRVPEEKRPAWMRTVVRHAVYAQYQKTRHLRRGIAGPTAAGRNGFCTTPFLSWRKRADHVAYRSRSLSGRRQVFCWSLSVLSC